MKAPLGAEVLDSIVKLGIENRKQVIWLAVLGGVALILLGREFWPSPQAAVPAAAPISSAPTPIHVKFFGFANKPGDPKKVFLSQDADVFIAGEGEIVDRRYRVLHISPNAVEVEDVINNNRQSLPLTQG